MERKIVRVRDNVYELVAKPSMEDFFDAMISGELQLSLAKEDSIYRPGEPLVITLPR